MAFTDLLAREGSSIHDGRRPAYDGGVGRMTVREVVRAIATSPEYMHRFVYTEPGEARPYERSVERLYRHLLGRQPDAAGLRTYSRIAEVSGAEAVIDRLIDSREYRQQFGDWGVPGSGGVRYCSPGTAGVGQTTGGGEGLARGRRFNAMDLNNDGVISRSEWSSTDRAFVLLDRNGDNVVSRSEFAQGAFGGVQSAPTAGESVAVDPRERWTDTGVLVRAGDSIVFDVNGTVRLSDDANDVATAAGARSGRRAVDAPMAYQTAGALIGQIDNGAPFFIGQRRSIRAPASGRLFLGVNDDYLADNQGNFDVLITVR